RTPSGLPASTIHEASGPVVAWRSLGPQGHSDTPQGPGECGSESRDPAAEGACERGITDRTGERSEAQMVLRKRDTELNQGQGCGLVNHSRHVLRMAIPGEVSIGLLSQVYDALRNFHWFNGNHNDTAMVIPTTAP